MNGAGTSKPLDRNNVGPSGVTARVRCECCGVVRSLGQFPKTSNTCVRCKPQGKNFRRGDI